MNKNYQGSIRFVDDETLVTESFGMTGDIVFVLEPGEETTTEKYVKATSTDEGALKVVANSDDVVTFTKGTSTDTGALEVVANDATPTDSQIKLEDVTGITVVVGDYVIKTVTPFDESTMVVLADVTADVADAAVGDYVVKKEVTTTTPPTVKSASVKLDRNWLPFAITE
jgi:hypothetical protein